MNRRSLFSFLGTLPVAGVGALAAVAAEQPNEPQAGNNLTFVAGEKGVIEWHSDDAMLRLTSGGLWLKGETGPWKKIT